MDETKQFLEPVTSDTDCPSVCPLCLKQPSKYTCPRCNTRYCSVDCYKSEKHRDCSEIFYKHCFMEGIVYALLSRIQEFLSGGIQARNSLNNGFFLCVCFSPQLILQCTEGVQWFYYRENYSFPRIQRGSNIFQGRSNFLTGGGGGVQMLISIVTHITCDFPGGVPILPSGSAHGCTVDPDKQKKKWVE